eukprot:s1012_g8.t1
MDSLPALLSPLAVRHLGVLARCYALADRATRAADVAALLSSTFGLASGEQPGVKLRLYSVALLLCCRAASPTCTVLRECEASLVWPGQTQCRLVAVDTQTVQWPAKTA